MSTDLTASQTVSGAFSQDWRDNISASVLIYLAACLSATTVLIVSGSNIWFWPSHIFMILVILTAILRPKNAAALMLNFRMDIGAFFLFGFIAYLVFRALSYGDSAISASYLKIVLNHIGAGLALGFFLVWDNREHEYSVRGRIWGSNIILSASLAAVLVISWILFGRARSDIFLIKISPGVGSYYQLFGDYILLIYIGIVYLLRRYLEGWSSHGIVLLVMRTASMLALTIWFGAVAQLVGSNNATASIAAICGLTVLFDVAKQLRQKSARDRFVGVLILSVQSMLAALITVLIIANLPPVRLFNFTQVNIPFVGEAHGVVPDAKTPEMPLNAANSDTADIEASTAPFVTGIESLNPLDIIGANRSVSSRISIFSELGYKQLAVNPWFGDLGAEIITQGPGSYIHSLISVQSHMGVVGSVLLLIFLLMRFAVLARHPIDHFVKSSVIVIVLVASLVTFFTWLPFWFAAGILLALPANYREKSPEGILA